ncbi:MULTISPECIES: hypothetical protein [Thioalkalivibrio]|uniref:hypothetical protein n=1 Tax=Thioalkalivibrio TaxID=106633 RepID=UPI00036B6D9C|nr:MULTISPECIES: hypothetical protein [Thioalkalivibrio]OOC50981.1 hypothetical protein B0684_01555 [Thioalkalivibrio versutus]
MSGETEWAWSWLRDRMGRNEQQGIDFGETRLIQRMLGPGAAVELERAIAEIGRKVPHFTHPQIVLTAILDALKFHAPDQVSEALRRVEQLSA